MEYTYVGKTKDFKERKRKHKNAFFNKNHQSHNFKVYRTIRDNYSWDLVYFEIIEDGLTKEEATVMEDVYIRKLDPQICLNSQNGIYTKEDIKKNAQVYYKKNREKILKNQRKYRQNNRGKILKNRKEKIECIYCGFKGRKQHLKRHQKSSICKKIKKNLLSKYYNRWRENIKKA